MRINEITPKDLDASWMRVGVVTARFNDVITSGLRSGAETYLDDVGVAELYSIDAPGAFELPLVAQALARAGFDAVVCLGAVIEGETDHYEHVAHRASEGLMRVQLDTGVPVAFGILTVRDVEAAISRSQPGEHNKGREAAAAAVEAAMTLRTIEHQHSAGN